MASDYRGSVLGSALGSVLLAVGILSSPAHAVVVRHTTLASFQESTRGNTFFEPFNGPDINAIASISMSGNGFSGVIQSDGAVVARSSTLGVGTNGFPATQFVFNGRPVSAFAGVFRVVNTSLASVGGIVTIETDTGESVSVFATPASTFFGFTTSQPFTSVFVNATSNLEFIDDVRIGIATNAVELSNTCADAVTINPITAVQYPFSTVNTGATATLIAGLCAGSDSGPDVWVRMVSTVYGTATISTCGATFDTILRVFGNCGPDGTGLGAQEIVCNDDFCNNSSQVQFRVEAGEDYFVRVSGFNLAVGSGNLAFSVVPDCRADFNRSGGPQNVPDIFDFLAAWFGGC